MIACVFPGQGAQYVGMGKDLYENFAESRNIFDSADKILGYGLSELCFNGPFEELTKTVNCQPAIFTVSIAALRAISCDFLEKISYMAGLSLGEYTALVAAEAISFESGLSLVASRAKFMQAAADSVCGKMASIIGLDVEKVDKIVKEANAEIANLNCPGQIVISGSADAVDKANELALRQGAKRVVNLDVSGAFHSSLMQSASQNLAGVLNGIEIRRPRAAVLSNVTAYIEYSPDRIKDNLIKQLTGSVFWEKTVRFMIGQGVKKFFEIGPGKVLKGLIRKIDSGAEVVNIEKKEDVFLLNDTI